MAPPAYTRHVLVGIDQQPANPPASGPAQARAAAGADQPAVIRAVTKVLRAGAAVVRAMTGAVRWLVNLWRRADQQATANGEAMAARLHLPSPSALSIWRSRT